MTDTTVSVNKDALKINVSQYGWTSVEVARVDLLSDYLNQAFALLQEVKDFQGEYDNFFDIYAQVTAMYNEITVKVADFNTKFPEVVRLHGEVVRLHREVQSNATTVSQNAVRVASDTSKVTTLSEEVEESHAEVLESATEIQKLYADIIDIVEELKKGNVYRGTWNPHSGAYPTNHQGTNSTWDVVLNAGETEYTGLGHTWYWGDRLIYLASDASYTQVETGSSVTSVNGLTGAVRLDMADIYRNTSGDAKLSIESGNGAVMVTDGPVITALNTKIEGIVGGAVISENPPIDPKEGVTWFCTTDARTYIWYKDEDGTVQWVDQNPDRIIIENIGGVPLLSSMWFPSRNAIPPGYVPADGQLVTRALYPEVWDRVNKGTVPTVPDAVWIDDPFSRGAYTTGAGTQFRLPDYNGRSPGSAGAPFRRGDGTGINASRITESQNKAHSHTRGDMNITGSIGSGVSGGFYHNEPHVKPAGAFGAGAPQGTHRGMIEAVSIGSSSVTFDASKSWTGRTSSEGDSEARPLNVTGVWALKMYDRLIDPSSIDVAEVTVELAKIKADLETYKGSGVPTGTIQWVAYDNVPFGYLLCDGRQVGRSTYPDLFKAIGTIYGAGNGIDTFNLPDLENEFIRGYSRASRSVGSKQSDAIRNITGFVTTGGSWGSVAASAYLEGAFKEGTYDQRWGNLMGSGYTTTIGRPLTFDASLVVPTADENRPRNVAMVPVIKAYSQVVNAGDLDVADLTKRVLDIETVLKTPREICLVHDEGTGAPSETVVAELPETISPKSRYVLTNPFGNTTPVVCWAEVFAGGVWADSGFIFSNSNGSYGTKASYVQGTGIVVQTGSVKVLTAPTDGGGGHGGTTNEVSAPCRVFVSKIL